MDNWKRSLWGQFGAAIDTLENALVACPEDLWSDRSRRPEYWHAVYHTLFFLDLYLSDSVDGFAPPAPFSLAEMETDAPRPERAYTKDELRGYLAHGRRKCRQKIEALSEEKAAERSGFDWVEGSVAELFLYNLRHVQHHAAQLNLILRQSLEVASPWVFQAKNEADSAE